MQTIRVDNDIYDRIKKIANKENIPLREASRLIFSDGDTPHQEHVTQSDTRDDTRDVTSNVTEENDGGYVSRQDFEELKKKLENLIGFLLGNFELCPQCKCVILYLESTHDHTSSFFKYSETVSVCRGQKYLRWRCPGCGFITGWCKSFDELDEELEKRKSKGT